jgi:hypothetical protein
VPGLPRRRHRCRRAAGEDRPGIRICALLRIVGGDAIPICVERALCPLATCKFWVYERQYCLGCREALS